MLDDKRVYRHKCMNGCIYELLALECIDICGYSINNVIIVCYSLLSLLMIISDDDDNNYP